MSEGRHGPMKLTRAWLKWRLRRAERQWQKADRELSYFFNLDSRAVERAYWLRDTVLPERIAYLRSRLTDPVAGDR